MNIGVIIQARTSSVRFPKKVLQELPYGSGITVLEQVIRRVKKAQSIHTIVVATTTNAEDEQITLLAKKENVAFYIGSRDNVLERYYEAAKENKIDIIIRITSDCPCIDPQILDEFVKEHVNIGADYTYGNPFKRYLHGLDVEVINIQALEEAYHNSTEVYEKEHVTPYIYRSHPEKFIINKINAPDDFSDSSIRITLDTKEDYALLCAVYDYLYPENNFFDVKAIVNLFKQKPWLKYINSSIIQKKIFNTLAEEIEEAIKVLKLQDLNKASDLLKNK